MTILVPLDGSLLAERALAPAIDLASKRQAELRLLEVVPPEHDTGPRLAYLEGLASSMVPEGIKVDCQAVQGEPVETILGQAKGAQMMVLASHGRSGFDRFFLGSVAEKVLRQAPCPALLVRNHALRLSEVFRVMVPLDGSDLSLKALAPAAQLCKETGATLLLCRVCELAGVYTPLMSQAEEEVEIMQSLEEISGQVDSSIKVEWTCGFGSAARTLVSLASQNAVDLVVMTSHGRSGLDRWVCGSVTEGFLRVSQIPVMVWNARGLAGKSLTNQ